jgi:predicted Zn-dependent protease
LTAPPEPRGSAALALAHAWQLLPKQPALAAEQAQEILRVVRGQPVATLILALAKRALGETAAALLLLEDLCRRQPQSATAHYELGMTQGLQGHAEAAITALRRAVTLKGDFADAWRALADQLRGIGDSDGADLAYMHFIKAAAKDPRLQAAAGALVANEVPRASELLRSHLEQYPHDVAALRMLAECEARLRRYRQAQGLLERCLELAPSFDAARHNYATVLNRQGKAAAALPEVERLLAKEPGNPGFRNLKAAVLANLGDYAGAAALYQDVLRQFPQQPKVWLSYGHALKTTGQPHEAIAAYRRAIDLQGTLGEAWWSLANLKTFRFGAADLQAVRTALARPELTDEDRLHLEFALGKALEDQQAWEESFTHYAAGNALRRRLHPYSAEENSRFVARSRALFTPEFFAARAHFGCPAPDPIFVLGLPRAGSTLLEQILASHSQVEGTMELPDVPQIARELARRGGRDDEDAFFASVAALAAADARTLGERYLEGTRALRKTSAPYFVDKMPNNCLYVGLIQLILPNAKIIDARRHPLGCCWSCFKQHFARGQNFTYSLQDLGRYYRDYVALMHHFDAVLPGKVHRVHYEPMVGDTEAQVRALLAHCGLAFEEACLRFYENDRAVRTASSEQVRQPIFQEGLDHWRHYEPWLGPLKQTLGPVLGAYPGVPRES